MPAVQGRLEALTRKWWFYLLILVLFFVPSYSTLPFDPRLTSDLIKAVLSNPLITAYPAVFPLFKLLPIVLVLALVVWGDRLTRLFDLYAAITLLLMAVFQNMAATQEFGFAVLVGNVVVYSLVALAWFWEAMVKANRLDLRGQPAWRYWVAPAAFLAFWFPVNLDTMVPDFSLAQLFTNSAGLAICMMLPVYMAVAILGYPHINRPVLRLTSFAGTVTAGLNMLQWFILAWYPWIGLLHLPLLAISVYCLVLSLKKAPQSVVLPM